MGTPQSGGSETVYQQFRFFLFHFPTFGQLLAVSIIDREFEFYEFFSFLKFNEFYEFFFG